MNNANDTRLQQLKHADAQLWRQVKAQAVLEGKTITEWVEGVLGQHLNRKKKS